MLQFNKMGQITEDSEKDTLIKNDLNSKSVSSFQSKGKKGKEENDSHKREIQTTTRDLILGQLFSILAALFYATSATSVQLLQGYVSDWELNSCR